MQKPQRQCGREEAPQRGLQHSVKPLVKRSGGEVAAPVVVVTVSVREEVATQRWQRRPRGGEEAMERAEVVGEGSELSLEERGRRWGRRMGRGIRERGGWGERRRWWSRRKRKRRREKKREGERQEKGEEGRTFCLKYDIMMNKMQVKF